MCRFWSDTNIRKTIKNMQTMENNNLHQRQERIKEQILLQGLSRRDFAQKLGFRGHSSLNCALHPTSWVRNGETYTLNLLDKAEAYFGLEPLCEEVVLEEAT